MGADKKKPVPRKVAAKAASSQLFVADEFREDAQGKVIAMGLMHDNIVHFQPAGEWPQVQPEGMIRVDRIALMLVVKGISGRHSLSINLRGDGQESPSVLVDDTVEFLGGKYESSTFIVSITDFEPLKDGPQEVTISVGDVYTHTHTFDVHILPAKAG